MSSIPEDAAQPEERGPNTSDTEEIATADTLRPGDALWTGGRWEPVTADPYTVEGVVHVPTVRDGAARTRTFGPGEPVRVQRRPHISDTEERAPARTARVGDDLWTAAGWVTITEVVDHGHAIELVTVDRQSVGHAWTSGPDEEQLLRRTNFRHFPWCSLEHCGALDPRVEYHRGAPVVVALHRIGVPRITLQLWADAMEPQDTARVTVVLTVDNTLIPGVPNLMSVDLDADAVHTLAAELLFAHGLFAGGAR